MPDAKDAKVTPSSRRALPSHGVPSQGGLADGAQHLEIETGSIQSFHHPLFSCSADNASNVLRGLQAQSIHRSTTIPPPHPTPPTATAPTNPTAEQGAANTADTADTAEADGAGEAAGATIVLAVNGTRFDLDIPDPRMTYVLFLASGRSFLHFPRHPAPVCAPVHFGDIGQRTSPIDAHHTSANRRSARCARRLSEFLRANRFTGTKVGCGEGGCGACAVMISAIIPGGTTVEHRTVNACLRLLVACDGVAVTTPEGIRRPDGSLHPIQQRVVDYNGSTVTSTSFLCCIFPPALRNARACRMLIGACKPTLCPIRVFRPVRVLYSRHGDGNVRRQLRHHFTFLVHGVSPPFFLSFCFGSTPAHARRVTCLYLVPMRL